MKTPSAGNEPNTLSELFSVDLSVSRLLNAGITMFDPRIGTFAVHSSKRINQMADDAQQRGEPDRSLVSLGQDHEIAYWTDRFGISVESLTRAVDEVGHSVDRIQDWLRTRR